MKGIIINSDSDGILKYIGSKAALPTSVEDIRHFAREFANTHVTDYFLCVADQQTTFPSEKYTSVLDKYHMKEENGCPVDYSEVRTFKGAHIVFEELGVDHNQIMIEEFRKIGINPWISFRMNDHHDRGADAKTGACLPDFYHEHPEYRMSQLPPGFTAYGRDRAFDFSFEEVRDYQIGMIDESLELYDCYGIELDFLRSPYYFRYGMEYDGVEIMNGYLRDIYAIVKKYEEKYGHEIKIAVRVPADIKTCFDHGMDVMQWVRDGIVDMVCPGSFLFIDNDMPIKLWSNLVKPYGVELAPCMEIMYLSAYRGAHSVEPNTETFAAFASSAYAQGADKFYVYNYFLSNVHINFDRESELDFDPNRRFWDLPIYWALINTLGDPDAVQKMNRRHVVTYNDVKSFWARMNPGQQLPMHFNKACVANSAHVFAGDIPEGAELTLRIAVSDTEAAIADPPRLYLNSSCCEYIGTEQDDRFAKSTVLCYSIPKEAHFHQLCPRFSFAHDNSIVYLEIYVKVTD